MTLVAIRGLGKRYDQTVALDNVDLDIPAEGRTAIVGASGSGKSTLLRLIAGFEPPDAGSITLGGEILVDGEGSVPAHRRAIGYVSQDGALFPHMTVADNVGFAIRRSERGREKRILDLLDLVQLDRGMANRKPHELSGGQQQRVALARTLAVRPKLVLLDEPFSALDAGLRESVRKTVAEVLSAARVATVLVTHDQEEALTFATHLAVLREGRLVQAGPPETLYRAPRDAAIAEFLGGAIILPAEVADGWATSALGRVPVDGGRGRDGPATILIRPEQVRIEAAPPAAPNGAAGPIATVAGAAFAGPTTMLRLRLEGGDAPSPAEVHCRVAGPAPPIGSRHLVSVAGTAHVFD